MADDKKGTIADRIIEPLKNAGEQLRGAGSKVMENSSTVNLKVLDHAEKNAIEAFNAMRAAAQASSISQVMEIQGNFLREQATRSMEQAREIGDLIAKFGRSAIEPLTSKKGK